MMGYPPKSFNLFQSQAGSLSTDHCGWLAALWERRRLAIREPEGVLACMGRLEESIAESVGFCKGHSGSLRSPFGRLPVFTRQRAWRDHRCVPRKNRQSLE